MIIGCLEIFRVIWQGNIKPICFFCHITPSNTAVSGYWSVILLENHLLGLILGVLIFFMLLGCWNNFEYNFSSIWLTYTIFIYSNYFSAKWGKDCVICFPASLYHRLIINHMLKRLYTKYFEKCLCAIVLILWKSMGLVLFSYHCP